MYIMCLNFPKYDLTNVYNLTQGHDLTNVHIDEVLLILENGSPSTIAIVDGRTRAVAALHPFVLDNSARCSIHSYAIIVLHIHCLEG